MLPDAGRAKQISLATLIGNLSEFWLRWVPLYDHSLCTQDFTTSLCPFPWVTGFSLVSFCVLVFFQTFISPSSSNILLHVFTTRKNTTRAAPCNFQVQENHGGKCPFLFSIIFDKLCFMGYLSHTHTPHPTRSN